MPHHRNEIIKNFFFSIRKEYKQSIKNIQHKLSSILHNNFKLKFFHIETKKKKISRTRTEETTNIQITHSPPTSVRREEDGSHTNQKW